VQNRSRVLDRPQEQDLVVFSRRVIPRRPVAGRDQMRMRIHEAGQDSGITVIDPLNLRPIRRTHVALATESRDPSLLDQ
jgi:hypothetical protein